MQNDAPQHVNRDRHGRGIRGLLIPAHLPIHESRDAFFAHQVAEAVADLDSRLGDQLRHVSFGFQEIPSAADVAFANGQIPLGRLVKSNPVSIVIFQRPIEARSADSQMCIRIIRDVLAEYVALYLGLEPYQVDSNYLGPEIR